MPPEPRLVDRALNPGWVHGSQPIVGVTWDDAAAYCLWAGGWLPTEAEWEYAARSGTSATRYGVLDEISWYADNSGRSSLDSASIVTAGDLNSQLELYAQRLLANENGPHAVGQKAPNAWGLYDMLGNVWEWVSGWYDKGYFRQSPAQGPHWGDLVDCAWVPGTTSLGLSGPRTGAGS
jgi:formylglycine-generating enzyme required for sulfatase activity